VRYEASVTVPDATEDADEHAPELAPDDLPDEVLIYTLPSRYCLPDVLGDEAWSRFGAMPTGYGRVQAICDHVNSHLTFGYGSSSAGTTAVDANISGFGVCRDFTHLAISFCRALNIPARYVFGYLPDMDVPPDPAPMDFAAWMEVWLGDRWWTFDPRNNTRRKGRILIGQRPGRVRRGHGHHLRRAAAGVDDRVRGRGTWPDPDRSIPIDSARRARRRTRRPDSAEPGDLDGDAEVLGRRTRVDAGQRPHVRVVAAAGQQHVPAAHLGQAGRVESHPVARPELHPGVALPATVSPDLGIHRRVQVAGDVAGGQPDRAQQGERHVREVLAYARAGGTGLG
jgi:hypothetical protein